MSLRSALRRLVLLDRVVSRRCLLIDATTSSGQLDRQKQSISQEGTSRNDVIASINESSNAIVRSTEQRTVAEVEEPISSIKLLHRERRAEEMYELMTAKWSPAVDSLICYQLAMDLLFEHGDYSQVGEIWHKFRSDSQLVSKLPYPRLMTVLLAASCYKSNSPALYAELLNVIEAMSASKKKIPARTLALAAATAMNQNDLDKALEVLQLAKTEVDEQPNTLIQSLKVIVLAKMKRFEEAMGEINALLSIDQPVQAWSRGCIVDGALDEFCAALRENCEFKLLASFRHVQKTLTASGRRISKSTEELLFVPIVVDYSVEERGLVRQSSPDDTSVQPHSDDSQLTVEDPQLTAYKAVLQKRIVKRILEHGPLRVENYRP